jgi:WD40 repeat protein
MARSSLPRGSSPSAGLEVDNLGLHVLHQPGPFAPLDIIFVHGLGGHSRKTWSKNHDPSLCWPELWLPCEAEIRKARIMSFGYNASLRVGGPKSAANISDFAKELLFEMGFAKDKNGEELGIGRVPIIFVVHSMGGLVVKKAYLLGQNDEEYKHIIHSICSIVFLATPHRGSNLAEFLNTLLKASFQSKKEFIKDLEKSSRAIEDLNEQFRHIAPKLSIFSFYETLATTVGPVQRTIVDKDSAVLGYPLEISRPLKADHHDVCKYSSMEDSNYISVRNALNSLVNRFMPKGVRARSDRMFEEVKDIERLLAISSGPEDDFHSFRRWWIPGTCDWLLGEPSIQSWLEKTPESRIVWFSAPPARGKSVLSTHIISHLLESGMMCQYFFFKFGDQGNRSLSSLLRSIAYQFARDNPTFKRALIELSSQGLKLEKADPAIIWHKLFETILFDLELSSPLYWVIDALDESDSPKSLLDLLRTIPSSRTALRILIISRKTEPLPLAFRRLSGSVVVDLIDKDELEYNSSDIRVLVEKEIEQMRGGNEIKNQVIKSIMNRANGNFLWVRLVLEEIVSCHTEEAIEKILDEIPSDMSKFYQRMELAILNNPRKADRHLAKALLQWTICAHRSLTLTELSQALKPEFSEFLDLKRTVQEVCGQFISVDQMGRVGVVHQTAREYLVKSSDTEISIDPGEAHGQLFMRTISFLLDPKLRSKLTLEQRAAENTEPFAFYAATSWTYHLQHSGETSDEALEILMKLFNTSSVLTWVHAVALIGRLEILVKAAKVLSAFLSAKRKLNVTNNPPFQHLSDMELLDHWTIDLVKLVGKFGRHLLLDPLGIYKVVPPFCPEKSILRRTFYQPILADLSVSGISNTNWNDNLAKLALPSGDRAWKIVCSGRHIAVLGSGGSVFLWSSYNFAEVCTLRHQEPVTAFCFNNKGSQLVTYGLRSTKLWSIPSSQLLSSILNPADCKAMDIVFAENDTKILTGSDDNVIRSISTKDIDTGWRVLNASLLKENSQIEGTFVNSPMCIAFNGDASQVAVSYRGYPLSVWSINDPRCIGKCRRAKQFRTGQSRASDIWFAVDRFTWNPVSGHIIGLYKDGCIFKWHPITDENEEAQSAADEVAASSDGKLFLTSDSNGTVRVWDFALFSVIYQLFLEDLVSGLSFSPDCRRFYDLRGSFVNAWEPNILTFFSETEEAFGDAGSENRAPNSASAAAKVWLGQSERVSALAVASDSSLYCVGNDKGVVSLFNTKTGESIELMRFLNFLNVSHIAWSGDGRHIAAADLAGEIMVKCAVLAAPGGFNDNVDIKPMPSPKLDLEGCGIHQLLFNDDSSLLLIITDGQGQIWAVEDGKMRVSITLEHGADCKWLKHPKQKRFFIGFGPCDVKVFQWIDFSEQSSLHFSEDRPHLNSQAMLFEDEQAPDLANILLNASSGHERTSIVNKAILTQGGKYFLVHIKTTSPQGRISRRLLVLDSSAFDADDKQKSTSMLKYSYIPPDILDAIETPLDLLSDSRLAFLDQDLWLCTFKLGSTRNEETFKRHYFIPRDWAGTDSLEQCCLLEDGTLLFPRQDQIAVIRSGLAIAGF